MESFDRFSIWLRGCEINGTKVYCLEGEGETGLYKVWKEYEYKHNYYNDVATYHVWIKGHWLTATTNYQSALAMWNNHKGGGG